MFLARNANEMKKLRLYCTSEKIWVNQGLDNKCISKSDVPYIANLPIYFDILLGGEREESNETLESVYMSSRQCKLYLCFPVMQTAHVPVGSFSCIK